MNMGFLTCNSRWALPGCSDLERKGSVFLAGLFPSLFSGISKAILTKLFVEIVENKQTNPKAKWQQSGLNNREQALFLKSEI